MGILNQKTINEQVNRINLLSNYKLGNTINENKMLFESDFQFPIDSNNFNVGYDKIGLGGKEKELDKDKAIHNSDYKGHGGIDIFAEKGEPLVACVDGIIHSIGIDSGIGGNSVTILGDDGNRYYYAHMDEISDDISKGEKIDKGTFIGTVGDTGNAKGTHPHLHFSIFRGNANIDPWPYLEKSIDNNPDKKNDIELIYNQIVSSIEGLGTDEDSLKDAVKQIKNCSDLQKINNLISKDPIDGEKYKNLYTYINSDMGWGDEELVEELEGMFNEICEDSVEVVDGVLVEKEPIDSGVLVDNVVEPTKLIRDLKREGLDDSLSKALAANAYGESGFKVNNYGDGGSYSKSAKNIDRSVEIKGDKFCSFGLWQFNICGGLGVGLLDFYGVDVDNSTDKEKLDVLTDYNKQVKFMVDHVKKTIPSEDKSVSEWINWIVDNVERPSDKSSAKSKRNKYAEEKGWI